MIVNIDNNLKNILKRIFNEISIGKKEIIVSSPEFKQVEIDTLISKGFLSKIDVSTLEGWAYNVSLTYDGEQVCLGNNNTLRDKVDDFIKRGLIIGDTEIKDLINKGVNEISAPLYDMWMGEINIFNERHLVKHPLYNSIFTAYNFRKRNTSYDDMMGHLIALSADDEFLGLPNNTNEVSKMNIKTIEMMLVEDIERCRDFLNNSQDENIGRHIYDEITGRYDSIIPDFGQGLYCYLDDQHFYDPEIDMNSLMFNLNKLVNKMEAFLAQNYSKSFEDNYFRTKKVELPVGNFQTSRKVFIVHGHDNEAKQEMARTLEKAGLEAVM